MILGITASHGLGARSGDFKLIETILLTGTQSSVTFSNLNNFSSDYRHFQIRTVNRSNGAYGVGTTLVRFNGDTGANYANHVLYAGGTSVSAFGEANSTTMSASTHLGSSASTNAFGAQIIEILDVYSSNINKTLRALGGSNSEVSMNSGHRRNTEALTSITILPQSGSWISGSRFSLYGFKG